ncbi:MAG: FlgO family outer membrane protein [Nitrospirota bacterium]
MHRLFFTMFILLTFLLSHSNISMAYEKEIKSISSTVSESIVKSGKKTIAVVDFTDLQGNVTELGRFLAEELSVDLTTTAQGFEVIDRTHLKNILAEHKLSISGLVDPNTVKKLGQIAGVDAIITGSVTPFGDSIRATVKVIATDTAKMIGAAKGDIAKTKAIEELLARGIESAQPLGQQPSTSGYVPSTSSPTSKKVGDIVVTVKKIRVSKDQVAVTLDFFNQKDTKLKLAIPWDSGDDYDPQLIDEKGNSFRYKSGLPKHQLFYDRGFKEQDWLTLNPKANNDAVVLFETRGLTYSRDRIDIKDIGLSFIFSLKYTLAKMSGMTG